MKNGSAKHNDKLKWIIGAGILVCGGTLVYLQMRQRTIKSIVKNADDMAGSSALPKPPIKVTPSATTATDANQGYPLKKGSRGALVKHLQDLLGVTTDGIFGSQTLQALQDQANVSEVDSAQQMQEIDDKISAQDSLAEAVDRGQQLYNDWHSGSDQLMAINSTTGQKYTEDKYGAITYLNGNFTLSAGYKFNRDQFQPVDYTKKGKLLVSINTGDTIGTFAFDPTDLSLG